MPGPDGFKPRRGEEAGGAGMVGRMGNWQGQRITPCHKPRLPIIYNICNIYMYIIILYMYYMFRGYTYSINTRVYIYIYISVSICLSLLGMLQMLHTLYWLET